MIEVRYNKKIHTRMGIVMKKKNVFLWTILTGIVITIILIFGPLKKDIWDTNASKLEDLTDSLSNPMVINDFSKWTPFEWDTLYSFAPYTTKETILITNVRPACGCTAANYTKTPIKPGEKGMVAATFNAASAGQFQKSVTITTTENGAEAVKTLSFKGKVLDPATEKKEEIKS